MRIDSRRAQKLAELQMEFVAGASHELIQPPGGQSLTTQMYVDGAPGNASDAVLNGIRDEAARASVIVAFTPMNDSRIGELAGRFDILLGFTPAS